jgi:hypothetical protein
MNRGKRQWKYEFVTLAIAVVAAELTVFAALAGGNFFDYVDRHLSVHYTGLLAHTLQVRLYLLRF